MKTYNGINVPSQIKPNLIISVFSNDTSMDKVEQYTEVMKAEMLGHNFPPIMGYPVIIDEDDLEGWFIDGSNIPETMLGKLAWKVTDGHHRSLAAINAQLPYITVMLDYSTITNETDLVNFKTQS